MEISTSAIWTIIAAYILLSTVLVAYFPGFIAPLKQGLSNAEEIEALDLQNKVRQTVFQICGGIGFLWSVFMALNAQDSSNRDLKSKYDRETAELFVKAVESKTPEALYALAYVARRDTKNYHEVVFRMLASLIKTLSPDACGESASNRPQASAKIQVALQLLHERPVENDPPETSYNIEHACLNGTFLGVNVWGKSHGLENMRASGAQMLRIDFTKAELQKAELMGISAGDWKNPGWDTDPHRLELHKRDEQGDLKWRAERRKYVAHFVNANLTDAKFNGAGLEGADFTGAQLGGAQLRGANISRASFWDAGVEIGQLMQACVGNAADDQPLLREPRQKELREAGGVKAC